MIEDYFIGLFFFLNLLGFTAMGRLFEPALVRMERPIRWLAGMTLTLYLFHMPLAQFFAAISPWPSSAWQTRVLVFGAVPMLVAVIAHYTERRKKVWHTAIERVVARLLPRLQKEAS